VSDSYKNQALGRLRVDVEQIISTGESFPIYYATGKGGIIGGYFRTNQKWEKVTIFYNGGR